MITGDSRYVDAERLFVSAPVYDEFGNPVMADRYSRAFENRETAYLLTIYIGATLPPQNYMAREGDNFQNLAWQLFQDPRKWWILADANPHIRHPFDLKMADPMNIPV